VSSGLHGTPSVAINQVAINQVAINQVAINQTDLPTKPRLLIAASGTGGHLFPAIAVAEHLTDYEIEWLGVPQRLEHQLVPAAYPLHSVEVEGFQTRGLGVLRVLLKLLRATWQVRALLQQGKFDGVFTTGGYIAAPAAIAARSLNLPIVLHESNALPGKVTRWLSPLCDTVAIGFAAAAHHLPRVETVTVGTPVRSAFLEEPPPELTDLPIPPGVPLLAIVGGSQGAVAINQLIRACAPAWLEAGIWMVHQTGDNDPDAKSLEHPHYFSLPFYQNMAALLHRADLVIGRSGAGTLVELAICGTPALLIPYPFAADDHQTWNARVFVEAGAAQMFRQSDLTPDLLTKTVLDLLQGNSDQGSEALRIMAENADRLAVRDSAAQIAHLIHQFVPGDRKPN